MGVMGVMGAAALAFPLAEPSERASSPQLREARTPRSADLRRLAEALRALAHERKNSLQYHLDVAKRVIDELYGGELRALRSDGERGPCFNQLARDLSSTIKRTTLHRALWAYEVRETTPIYRVLETGLTLERAPREEVDFLGVSHLYEVRALATALRSDLLSRALDGRWSVRRLRREIDAHTRRQARTALPRIVELLRQLRNLPPELDLSPLADLSDADAILYQDVAERLRDIFNRSHEALAQRLSAKETA